jgi:hypothetical protein
VTLSDGRGSAVALSSLEHIGEIAAPLARHVVEPGLGLLLGGAHGSRQIRTQVRCTRGPCVVVMRASSSQPAPDEARSSSGRPILPRPVNHDVRALSTGRTGVTVTTRWASSMPARARRWPGVARQNRAVCSAPAVAEIGLQDHLRLNPVVRGWCGYFRWAASFPGSARSQTAGQRLQPGSGTRQAARIGRARGVRGQGAIGPQALRPWCARQLTPLRASPRGGSRAGTPTARTPTTRSPR